MAFSPVGLARKLILSLCFTVQMTAWAGAKDLSGRIGAGVQNLGPDQVPSLSVVWQASNAAGIEGNLGLNSVSSFHEYVLGARLIRALFVEENQDFAFYAGAGFISSQPSLGTAKTGYYLHTGMESRFFLPGLPNFGLKFGGGVKLSSAATVNFRTEIFAGAHYYF